MSQQKLAYPAHTRDLEEDKDEALVRSDHTAVSDDGDDQPLVQPARKENVKEKCVPATDDGNPAKKKRTQDPTVTLEQEVSGNSRRRSEEVSIFGRNPESEALRSIINKLSDERNLRDLHLKHYHLSTAPFKKRTPHLDIPRKVHDLYQHMVKTCPSCNSTEPRPERSRVSGLRAEEFGDLIFLDNGSTKIEDKTFGFLFIWDGTTSHLTAFPCKSTSPSEVISQLHECMDTFQVNPKAICSDMAFHQAHDMQAFYRMHNVKRDGCTIVQEVSLSALVDTASKNLDEITLSQITPAQLMRKTATIGNTQVTLSGKTCMELAMKRKP